LRYSAVHSLASRREGFPNSASDPFVFVFPSQVASMRRDRELTLATLAALGMVVVLVYPVYRALWGRPVQKGARRGKGSMPGETQAFPPAHTNNMPR
jgi:hypothetical protein